MILTNGVVGLLLLLLLFMAISFGNVVDFFRCFRPSFFITAQVHRRSYFKCFKYFVTLVIWFEILSACHLMTTDSEKFNKLEFSGTKLTESIVDMVPADWTMEVEIRPKGSHKVHLTPTVMNFPPALVSWLEMMIHWVSHRKIKLDEVWTYMLGPRVIFWKDSKLTTDEDVFELDALFVVTETRLFVFGYPIVELDGDDKYILEIIVREMCASQGVRTIPKGETFICSRESLRAASKRPPVDTFAAVWIQSLICVSLFSGFLASLTERGIFLGEAVAVYLFYRVCVRPNRIRVAAQAQGGNNRPPGAVNVPQILRLRDVMKLSCYTFSPIFLLSWLQELYFDNDFAIIALPILHVIFTFYVVRKLHASMNPPFPPQNGIPQQPLLGANRDGFPRFNPQPQQGLAPGDAPLVLPRPHAPHYPSQEPTRANNPQRPVMPLNQQPPPPFLQDAHQAHASAYSLPGQPTHSGASSLSSTSSFTTTSSASRAGEDPVLSGNLLVDSHGIAWLDVPGAGSFCTHLPLEEVHTLRLGSYVFTLLPPSPPASVPSFYFTSSSVPSTSSFIPPTSLCSSSTSTAAPTSPAPLPASATFLASSSETTTSISSTPVSSSSSTFTSESPMNVLSDDKSPFIPIASSTSPISSSLVSTTTSNPTQSFASSPSAGDETKTPFSPHTPTGREHASPRTGLRGEAASGFLSALRQRNTGSSTPHSPV